MNRRDCLKSIGAAGAAASFPQTLTAANDGKFAINYVLGSALYGDMDLSQILAEVEHTGTAGIDIWDRPHGTQRLEVDKIGVDEFEKVLKKYGVEVIVSTRHSLGCFGLQPEMPILKQLGGKILVSGSPAEKQLKGKEAKSAVLRFIEKMIPHADAAEEHGLTIAIANHRDQLISSKDTIEYFGEFNRHPSLGLALAPHHFKDATKVVPELILSLGKPNLPMIYFQEYGDGAFHQLQKQVELEQLPGRGSLDYSMVARALKAIEFDGFAEISMHTTPRGLPVFGSAEEITEMVNESRIYVDRCVKELG